MKFSSTVVTRVIETEMPLLDPAELYPDSTPEILAREAHWLMPRFQCPETQKLILTMQGFVLQSHGKTILVDTCVGDCKHRARPLFDNQRWGWLDRFRAAGFDPEGVDIVLSTHLHVDHVGWNTMRDDTGQWRPTFPNARYLFTRPEVGFWTGPAGGTLLPRTGDYIADSVSPIFAAGLADVVEMDHRINPEIRLLPTPGHSPGHVCVEVGCGQDLLVIAGDILHTVLQCAYPQWSTRFCADAAASRETRIRFLQTYADTETLVAPAHFPSPGVGRIRSEGAAFRFVFDTQAR